MAGQPSASREFASGLGWVIVGWLAIPRLGLVIPWMAGKLGLSTLPGALTINNIPFSLTENLPETVPGLRVFGGTRPQVGNAAKSFILFYFIFFLHPPQTNAEWVRRKSRASSMVGQVGNGCVASLGSAPIPEFGRVL